MVQSTILEGITMNETIHLVINNAVLDEYTKVYFEQHPRAKKPPIKFPYHESINVWMIMKRPMMNALKQKWKSFICWFAERQGLANLNIDRCEITQTVYYPNNRRHDTDNSTPKFILDGLVDGKVIVDDDMRHLTGLHLYCDVDEENPRTELEIKIW